MKFRNIRSEAVLITLLLPGGLALAADPNTTWIREAINQTSKLITTVVPALVAVALLIFVWGIVIFITRSGNQDAVAEGKNKMIWGIVALFVIVSVWGLVALLQQLTGVKGTDVTRPSFTVTGQ